MGVKIKKITALCLAISVSLCTLSGCSGGNGEADFSGINTVCELATLKCYYHNVAKAESEASGLFKVFGVGYKKIWTEYSGVVEYGIDVGKVAVSEPDRKGVVTITIPEAEVLNTYPDEDSVSEPLTDTGFLTKITKEEETASMAAAQENMKQSAAENTEMLQQARERAKSTIEGYVKNVGQQLGKTYTVKWKDYE